MLLSIMCARAVKSYPFIQQYLKINIISIQKMSDSKSPPLGSFILNPPTQVKKNTPTNISNENVIQRNTNHQTADQKLDSTSEGRAVNADAKCKQNSDILKTFEGSVILSNRNQILKGGIQKTVCQELENTVGMMESDSNIVAKEKANKLATSEDLDTSLNRYESRSVVKKTDDNVTGGSEYDNLMMKWRLTGPPKIKRPILPVQLSQLVSETVRQQYNDEKIINIPNIEKCNEDYATRPSFGLNENKADVTGCQDATSKNVFENVTCLSKMKEGVIACNVHVEKEFTNESLISPDISKGDDSGFVDLKDEHELTPLKHVFNIVSDSLHSSVDIDKGVKPTVEVAGENELKCEIEDTGEVSAIDVQCTLKRTMIGMKKEDSSIEIKGFINSDCNPKDNCTFRADITETFSQVFDKKSLESAVLESDKDILARTESSMANADTIQEDKNDIVETLNEKVDSFVLTELTSANDECHFELDQEKKLISCNDDLVNVKNDYIDDESDSYTDAKKDPMVDWLSSPLDNIELSLETESTNLNDHETNQQEKKKKKNKKKEKKYEEKVKKPKKDMPNYFISLQITNPEIHAAIDDVKNTISSKNKDLLVAMVPTPTIHLTLMVMHLADNKDIDSAKVALDKCAEKLSPLFDNKLLIFDICGIGNFKNEIVFAKVSPGEALDDLTYIADTVKTCFEENDILSSDGKPFNPHITMMKLSKGSHKLKKKGIKKFPSDLYTEHVNKFFGKQLFTGLHLCSMLKRKGPTGYYHIEHQVKIGPQKSNFSTLTSVQCHSLEEVSTFIVHACVQSAMEQVQSEKYKEIAQKLDTSPKGSITQSEKVVKKTKCINNSNKNVKKTEKEKVSKNAQQTGNEKVSENVQKTKNLLDTEHKKVSKNVKKTENKKVLKKGENVGNEKVSKNVQKARNEKVSENVQEAGNGKVLENVQEAGNGKVCANVQKY